MKILVTRCTLWDMAGVAMIRGLENGLMSLGIKPEIGALVFQENDNPLEKEYRQFIDNKKVVNEEAFDWCDVAVDLGGVCKGLDPYRFAYIRHCREIVKPYMYGAQSFIDPAPEIVKGIPAIARGRNSANEFERATGHRPTIGADTSFLLRPYSWFGKAYYAFVTHLNKPYEPMRDVVKKHTDEMRLCLQVVLKQDRDGKTFEPDIELTSIPPWYGPESLFGVLTEASEVHTSRYHAAVAAIMADVPLFLYVDYWPKYEDLLFWKGMPLDKIRESAMETAKMAAYLGVRHES